MGTITQRPRKDGSIAYMAQVRLKREGRVVFDRTVTFNREQAARTWITKTEKEMAKPGAIDAARRPKGTLADLIDRYLATSRRDIGRTKAQVLAAIKRDEIAKRGPAEITSAELVNYAERLGLTRKLQIVQNYLSHLGAVFAVARDAWDMDVDPEVMRRALATGKRRGLVSKSAQRSRRPTMEELDALMRHFLDRSARRNALPMHRVVAFAIFSTRRQEEIVRLRWGNLEPGRVLVKDMKNPGETKGNDVWCVLVPEAEAIVESIPRASERIFPYSTDAVSAAFTRACKLLGIENLHFHDLRHEGISRLFEMGWTIPRVAEVSGHRSWQSLQRYSHLRQTGDRLAGWSWLEAVTARYA